MWLCLMEAILRGTAERSKVTKTKRKKRSTVLKSKLIAILGKGVSSSHVVSTAVQMTTRAFDGIAPFY